MFFMRIVYLEYLQSVSFYVNYKLAHVLLNCLSTWLLPESWPESWFISLYSSTSNPTNETKLNPNKVLRCMVAFAWQSTQVPTAHRVLIKLQSCISFTDSSSYVHTASVRALFSSSFFCFFFVIFCFSFSSHQSFTACLRQEVIGRETYSETMCTSSAAHQHSDDWDRESLRLVQIDVQMALLQLELELGLELELQEGRELDLELQGGGKLDIHAFHASARFASWASRDRDRESRSQWRAAIPVKNTKSVKVAKRQCVCLKVVVECEIGRA